MPERPLAELLASGGWLAMGLSLWGGMASFVRKVRAGLRPSVAEFVGELVISGFCGALTLLAAQHYGLDAYVTGAMAGIAGHMGSKAIVLAERFIERKSGQWLGR